MGLKASSNILLRKCDANVVDKARRLTIPKPCRLPLCPYSHHDYMLIMITNSAHVYQVTRCVYNLKLWWMCECGEWRICSTTLFTTSAQQGVTLSEQDATASHVISFKRQNVCFKQAELCCVSRQAIANQLPPHWATKKEAAKWMRQEITSRSDATMFTTIVRLSRT